MTVVDDCLLAAVADVRAFNNATSVIRLASHVMDPDEAYRVLDTAEVMTHLMAQAFVRVGLALGRSLSHAYGHDDLTDVAMADLTAAAGHMVEVGQLISAAADKIAPMVDRDPSGHFWSAIVTAVRNWASIRAPRLAA
ncbi:hypothetical protein [Mycobacterium paragordonae]|uniref:hypothetical protein n=1 Tax=Mycobacterium paragordonae TaxID=1389713 RepID=UPI0012E2B9C4|nr:hypothetical protein [Mycobacterium paragordonae]